MQVQAIVTACGAPPQNLTARHYADWVFVVADLGSGPTLIRSVVRLDRDRWLVPGMQVPIEVDPGSLDAVHVFKIDWDAVPTIIERVDANDPCLADPRAARAAAKAAQEGAADHAHAPTGPISRLGQPLYGLGQNAVSPSSGMPLDTSSWTAECDRAIEHAASAQAPAGRKRAVVIPAAMRMVFRETGHHWDGSPDLTGDSNQSSFESSPRGNETVLAVNVPGQPPYAVFEPHFKSPRSRPVYRVPTLYPWLPALVSDANPSEIEIEIEIVWDEVPDETGRLSEMTETGFARAAERVQTIQSAYAEGLSGATAQKPSFEQVDAIADPMQRATALAAAVGAYQASAPDEALLATARENAAKLKALPPDEQAKQVAIVKQQLTMVGPEMAQAFEQVLREPGLEV
jgi:hypothetical protein